MPGRTAPCRHDSLSDFGGTGRLPGGEILELVFKLLPPCALEDQITEENVQQIWTKAIVEGANGPS